MSDAVSNMLKVDTLEKSALALVDELKSSGIFTDASVVWKVGYPIKIGGLMFTQDEVEKLIEFTTNKL